MKEHTKIISRRDLLGLLDVVQENGYPFFEAFIKEALTDNPESSYFALVGGVVKTLVFEKKEVELND